MCGAPRSLSSAKLRENTDRFVLDHFLGTLSETLEAVHASGREAAARRQEAAARQQEAAAQRAMEAWHMFLDNFKTKMAEENRWAGEGGHLVKKLLVRDCHRTGLRRQSDQRECGANYTSQTKHET